MIQTLILKNLMENENYTRKVIPFLKKEYFEGPHRFIFDEMAKFVAKYNKLPTATAMMVEFDNQGYNDDIYAECGEVLSSIQELNERQTDEWLIENTEKFCQDRAIHIAIMKSISIIDGSDQKLNKGSIPDLLNDALAVTFDLSIGHDYLEDAEERFEFFQNKENGIEFDLDIFNEITNGGFRRKTLNVLMASTGVGKSLTMCHMATAHLSMGKNVLYITCEMSEEMISQRIDANLLNVPIDRVETLSKEVFVNKVNAIAQKTAGKLIVKEYPTSAAHVGHFRALMKELKLKKNFVPDVVYIDYLNICASSRITLQSGSYTYIKAIAEELRGFAKEFNVPVISATQSNRDGANNSDVDLTNTSESWGLPQTVDFMAALISNETLEEMGQILVKQLKNRYNDLNKKNKFVVGVDKSKMRLYDVDQSGQVGIAEDKPVADNSDNNFQDFTRTKSGKNFDSFKV